MFRYNLNFQTNLRSLREGRTLTEDGKKILNLLIEIDQKHIEILRNNMKKLSNDRLIYKLKERLTNVELKLLEDSMSEVDKKQMIIGMCYHKIIFINHHTIHTFLQPLSQTEILEVLSKCIMKRVFPEKLHIVQKYFLKSKKIIFKFQTNKSSKKTVMTCSWKSPSSRHRRIFS